MPEKYRPQLWKAYLARNDAHLNNYMPIVSLALGGANSDTSPCITANGVINYVTKYITKDDNPDLFRDFRDDAGRPVDADNRVHRSEIPLQESNVAKITTKLFNDQIKYNMISSPELHHHLLKLPTHFVSRSFLRINLQSTLNKLIAPEEVSKSANGERSEQTLVKEERN